MGDLECRHERTGSDGRPDHRINCLFKHAPSQDPIHHPRRSNPAGRSGRVDIYDGALGYGFMLLIPGRSYRETLPALTADQQELAAALHRDVRHLDTTVLARHVFRFDAYVEAASFIESSMSEPGFEVVRQTFEVSSRTCVNLEVELPGQD